MRCASSWTPGSPSIANCPAASPADDAGSPPSISPGCSTPANATSNTRPSSTRENNVPVGRRDTAGQSRCTAPDHGREWMPHITFHEAPLLMTDCRQRHDRHPLPDRRCAPAKRSNSGSAVVPNPIDDGTGRAATGSTASTSKAHATPTATRPSAAFPVKFPGPWSRRSPRRPRARTNGRRAHCCFPRTHHGSPAAATAGAAAMR